MNILQRLIGLVLALALTLAAVVFASVVLALAAAIAVVLGAWLWWRGRQLRREVERSGGAVIEGEYRVESEVRRIRGTDSRPPC